MTAGSKPISFLRGDQRYHEPLASYTSWRVGGRAERFYRPADRQDLLRFLHTLPVEEPLLWLGLGSNVLIRDGGVRGTVICTVNRLPTMRMEGERVYAEAGVPCAHVARFCSVHGLTGMEFLAGIPGTLGGALAMNAGAFGSETWNWVEAVETVDRNGEIHRRQPGEYQISYRNVQGPVAEEWFLAAWLRPHPGDIEEGQRRIRELLARRKKTQPTRWPNGGSVFKNPPNDHAARLIESCHLKGLQIGGAKVSELHANFIVNTGNASANDIETLIETIRAEVRHQRGIELELEIQIVGEPEVEVR